MIHYICDRCKRQINTNEQPRYVVQIEIHSMADEVTLDIDDDIDQLSELHQALEGLACDHLDDEPELDHRGSYDLCADCHRQFLRNPLGRDAVAAFGFSNN
ncbi:hypothetical protein Pla22_02230 [Rubripirellula amarantea]|uniref:Uncharacterized protein n=1 Tax=Rubripirellula amarantea TaxID=2527999 RepID=A0A5C5WR09_9BACT|nr:hypothetical protein [Rubripirellula amarantea]TWT52599.1 hypothetical protein Pla22_02230 [Rubripirellula amarantea]